VEISIKAKAEDMGYNVDVLTTATVESFRHAVAGVAKAAQAEWIRIAQNRLGSSKDIYINGLRMAESFVTRIVGTTTIFEISLVGRMPNYFEFGMPAFDMKAVRPGWLGGKRAKTAKDGHKYVVIPFRHSLAKAGMLAYSGKAAKADLRKELKNVVRWYGLNKMVRLATGEVTSGPVKRIPRGSPVHRYLSGLTRIQKPSTVNPMKGSSKLLTFRVMSENSPASSWQHPGIEAKNLMREVEIWIDRELDNVITTIMEATS
jgi:hypothetical protein